MTATRCVGGPIDGKSVDVEGVLLLKVPVVTEGYSTAMASWFESFGVAWALETLDGIPAEPLTPPPPPFPQAIYLHRVVDGHDYWVFSEVAA